MTGQHTYVCDQRLEDIVEEVSDRARLSERTGCTVSELPEPVLILDKSFRGRYAQGRAAHAKD